MESSVCDKYYANSISYVTCTDFEILWAPVSVISLLFESILDRIMFLYPGKIGNQPPQLVLMQSSAASTPGGSTLHSSKLQPSVFTLTSNNTNISPSTITAAGGGASTPVNSQGTASTSAPMIVILTGPPATMASTSGATNNSNNAGMPLSVPQPVNSGQGVVLRFLPYRR